MGGSVCMHSSGVGGGVSSYIPTMFAKSQHVFNSSTASRTERDTPVGKGKNEGESLAVVWL